MNLQRLLLILRARFWMVFFTLVVTVATTAILSYVLPKTYTATTSIMVDFKGTDPVAGTLPPPQLLPGYMSTQMDIIASHKVALKVVDSLQLDAMPEAREQFEKATGGKGSIRDWLADALLENMKAEPSAESSLVHLSYSSTDPRFSAAVANAFAQAYIKTTLELKIEPARETANWFNDQLKLLRSNLEQAQAKLSAFQQQKGIVATDEKLDIENARLSELSTQLVMAQNLTQDTLSKKNQINSSPDKAASMDSLPEIISNPYIQGLKSELAKQEVKVSEISSQVGKNHPQYRRAQAELESMRRKVASETLSATGGIVNNAQSAQQRETALKSMLAAQKAKVLELRKQRDEIAVFLRDVDNAQRAYDTALQRFNQTNMESQMNQTNVTVLSPALEPIEPSAPKPLLNIALAIFFGAILGVCVALLTEMGSRYIRSEDDIIDDLNLPVLGMLTKSYAQLKGRHQPKRLESLPAGLRPAA